MDECVELSDDSDFESPVTQRRRVSQGEALSTSQTERQERHQVVEEYTAQTECGSEGQAERLEAYEISNHFAEFVPIDLEEDEAIEEAIRRSLDKSELLA
ncbi:hypothetical protein SKAU_G00281000 [Synaphobranchus kaupii]|uniref:Uncharacterized protein n=1 Tax=Synaphobranchus kaupii TaxID=118154 RepID=A0A9Q1EX19_SYNKA|nr:hypothetical protein SKAU_G00281000 [Synaphobranchus kaupii]